MNRFVCVAGMTGSGKTSAAHFLEKRGYQFLRFGQVVLDEVKKEKIAPTEKNESKIRENLRKKYGPAAVAKLLLPKIKKLIKSGNVVIDGLYSWSEYKLLKEKFGEKMVVIAVFSPPEARYKRLSKRVLKKSDIDLKMRPATHEDAKKRDYAEIENIEKGGPIAMADYTILNTSGKKFFHKQIIEVQIDLEKNLK